MGISKVIILNNAIIDLTNDSVTEDSLLQNVTAHDNNGDQVTGTVSYTFNSIDINENGIYKAEDYDLSGFNEVNVDIPIPPIVEPAVMTSKLSNEALTNLFANSPSPLFIDNIEDCSDLFSFNNFFNHPVTIGNNVINCINMFHLTNNFNSRVSIGNNVTKCGRMFWGCYNYNQPTIIPDNVIYAGEMFHNCTNLNAPVTIGNNVITCSYMFKNCHNFNQPVKIPDSVTDCQNMFEWCHETFNSPVTIGNSVTNCQNMFAVCWNFNQPITIPDSVTNCFNMFASCFNISEIYIDRTSTFNAVNMIRRSNGTKQVNLFCNNLSLLTGTTAATSITGTDITWSEITNGYYNEYYNVYLYNNYSKETGVIP